MNPNPHDLVLFQLYRQEDTSGISGEGTVAFGIRFPEPNARVALGWVANKGLTSVAVYDSIEAVKRIHGHGGSSKLIQMNKIDCGGPTR
jgi:hypothetical protein